MAPTDGHDVVLSTEDSDIDTDEEIRREKDREKMRADKEMAAHKAKEATENCHPDAVLKKSDLLDELFEGDEWIEIMPQAVKFRVVSEGSRDEESQPEKDQYIIASYDVWLATDRSSEPLQSYHSVLHKMGEAEAVPALELTWRHTKSGGVSEVVCVHRFGWGPVGRKGIPGQDADIPPEANLFIRTRLEEVLPIQDPDPDDKLAIWNAKLLIMNCRKINGNDHFKRGVHSNAIKCYEQGMAVFLQEAWYLKDEMQLEQKQKADELLVDCSSNLAACFLELQDGPKAMLAVECGLHHAVNNLKLNFRAAKAELLMSNYKACEQWLADALKIAPNDAACIQLQAQLRRAQLKHARDKKKMGQKLVRDVNWSEATPEASCPKRFATAVGNFSWPYVRGMFVGASMVIVVGGISVILNYLPGGATTTA